LVKALVEKGLLFSGDMYAPTLNDFTFKMGSQNTLTLDPKGIEQRNFGGERIRILLISWIFIAMDFV
jgi:hypothetical protein